MQPALSVIIPTLNAAVSLPATLARLAPWAPGLEVVVVDGGSIDGTAALAADSGARVIQAPRGRGPQLAAGADAATSDWLLFLHADTRPDPAWVDAVSAFIADPGNRGRAAHFRFVLDADHPRARRWEALVAWRCRVLALPYGDQGLLIHRDLYRAIGGYRPLPLMEDVDIVRRLGRNRLAGLDVPAMTSAARWQRDGWVLRSARNLFCLSLWFLGVPPRLIAKVYG